MTFPFTFRLLAVAWLAAVTTACNCGGAVLVSREPDPVDAGMPLVQVDAGTPEVDAGMPGPWCGTDCDCAFGSRCIGASELAGNHCEPGTNTCPTICAVTCGSGTQCIGGTCQPIPCTGSSCPSAFGVSVAGKYNTHYEFDIHSFAERSQNIAKLIDLLASALSGNAACTTQTDPFEQLLCVVLDLATQNLRAPPWVQNLLAVLSGMFKFGNQPIIVNGTMELAETVDGHLFATESWNEMWMSYNGQLINVMNSPMVGSVGNFSVTVKTFEGYRDTTHVVLGPREVEFDVNKLLVNIINVGIQAGSQNRARDVGELFELILCDQVQVTNPLYGVCVLAANELAKQFQIKQGFGGMHIDNQRGAIIDVDMNGLADSLGTTTARGSLNGGITNGITSGAFGGFPATNWYGVK
ncbi:MAG: hypothetical protein K1X64_14930 [Myxococcaceae bacterium]|nr:hypothetical protein [Myxococcaceae bacterium]